MVSIVQWTSLLLVWPQFHVFMADGRADDSQSAILTPSENGSSDKVESMLANLLAGASKGTSVLKRHTKPLPPAYYSYPTTFADAAINSTRSSNEIQKMRIPLWKPKTTLPKNIILEEKKTALESLKMQPNVAKEAKHLQTSIKDAVELATVQGQEEGNKLGPEFVHAFQKNMDVMGKTINHIITAAEEVHASEDKGIGGLSRKATSFVKQRHAEDMQVQRDLYDAEHKKETAAKVELEEARNKQVASGNELRETIKAGKNEIRSAYAQTYAQVTNIASSNLKVALQDANDKIAKEDIKYTEKKNFAAQQVARRALIEKSIGKSTADNTKTMKKLGLSITEAADELNELEQKVEAEKRNLEKEALAGPGTINLKMEEVANATKKEVKVLSPEGDVRRSFSQQKAALDAQLVKQTAVETELEQEKNTYDQLQLPEEMLSFNASKTDYNWWKRSIEVEQQLGSKLVLDKTTREKSLKNTQEEYYIADAKFAKRANEWEAAADGQRKLLQQELDTAKQQLASSQAQVKLKQDNAKKWLAQLLSSQEALKDVGVNVSIGEAQLGFQEGKFKDFSNISFSMSTQILKLSHEKQNTMDELEKLTESNMLGEKENAMMEAELTLEMDNVSLTSAQTLATIPSPDSLQLTTGRICHYNFLDAKAATEAECAAACNGQPGCGEYSIGVGGCRYAKDSQGCCERVPRAEMQNCAPDKGSNAGLCGKGGCRFFQKIQAPIQKK